MTDTGITVKAFGPSPALRGGELRFVGTNVDRATAVVIPGVPEITEFTKKEKTEIRVIIPQTAQEGYVILRTPQGDITPKTMLTFSEPIVIESITTTKVKSGDDFEVTGDYLNLIAKVVFQENVVVESTDFVSQSRERIVVKVPLKARSGEIMIANGEEIPIEVYSGDLQADIVEPAIVSVAPSTVKAGSDITITGVDFDLVEKVVFGGEKIVTEFTVSEDKKSITVTTPADAQDGPVMLVAYSGVEVISEASLTLKMPVATIENKKVKNGETVTITGTGSRVQLC
jgi:DnaJ-class molecular chaperone